MPYVGHRVVLPGQNTNEWKHNVNDVVGVYSNWSLQSSIHALQDVGDPALPSYPQYAQGRHLSQVFTGKFEYRPMELARFSHGGQSAPYLRHINWKWQGVESAEAFPRGVVVEEAKPAQKEMGVVATGRDYSETPLKFTIFHNGDSTEVELTGDYGTRPAYVAALNEAVDGATFEMDSETNVLTVTSDVIGDYSQLAIAHLENGVGSGIEEILQPVYGQDAVIQGAYGYTLADKVSRKFTFSRHSNWFFYGVPAADATFDGRVAMDWDDPNLPSYARRHAPFVYKGVGEDRLEDAGEALAVKQARAAESNEYAHQQVNVWDGVASAKAL